MTDFYHKCEKRRVVVTGLGMVTPLGLELEDSWRMALAGVSGIGKLSHKGAEKSPVQAVGRVKDEDWRKIEEEFPSEVVSEGERRTLFALWAARCALNDAGIEHNATAPQRSGVAVAAGLGINALEDIHRWVNGRNFDYESFGRQLEDIRKESILRNNANRPSALIANKFGLNGPNLTVTSACASATQAIGLAFRMIRRGEADLILAGGADSMINPVGLIFFVLLGAAAVGRIEPHEACRPFDRKRSGLVMGEGAGVAVLEEESHAVRRGARIYAEVVGYGSSMDAFKLTAPHPEGRGAEHAMKMAMEDAGVCPGDIDYINAHGTSTKLNDVAETIAIKRVFGEHSYNLAVSSSKSVIGHLLAASGGPEFIFTVLSVLRDRIHPTLNLVNRDPKCDLDYVANVERRMTVRAAISNSFGFGGQNSSIVVRKYGSTQ